MSAANDLGPLYCLCFSPRHTLRLGRRIPKLNGDETDLSLEYELHQSIWVTVVARAFHTPTVFSTVILTS